MSNTTKRGRKSRRASRAGGRFAMRLDPRVREQLADFAKGEKRTLSNYVRCILEAHVAAKVAAANPPGIPVTETAPLQAAA
jgi:predicted HicB family RNase H-like nuclease